jgi:hypothetical protein
MDHLEPGPQTQMVMKTSRQYKRETWVRVGGGRLERTCPLEGEAHLAPTLFPLATHFRM